MKRLGLIIACMVMLAVNLPVTAKASEDVEKNKCESEYGVLYQILLK